MLRCILPHRALAMAAATRASSAASPRALAGVAFCRVPRCMSKRPSSSRAFGTSAVNCAEDQKKPTPNLEGLAAQVLLGRIDADPSAAGSREAEADQQQQQPGEEGQEGGGEGKGERPERPPRPGAAEQPTLAQRVLKTTFMLSFLGGAVWLVGGPSAEDDDKSLTPAAFAQRARKNFTEHFASFSKPSYDKLLPDALPHGYQKEYTLVINLNDTLLHTHWDPQRGWVIVKRPDVDKFLGYMGRFYEIVVFTRSSGASAMQLIDQVDSYGGVHYKLFKNATRYKDGKHIKDLSQLNRDLSKVIIMDWDEEAFSLQPENAIHLKRWDGRNNGQSLKDFIPFLEKIAISGVPDVRPILESYKGQEIPTVFAERQAAYLKRMQDELSRPEGASQNGGGSSGRSSGGLRGLLGSNRVALQQQYQHQLEIFNHSQRMQKQFEEEAEMIKEEQQKMIRENTERMQQMFREQMPERVTLWQHLGETWKMMMMGMGFIPPPEMNPDMMQQHAPPSTPTTS